MAGGQRAHGAEQVGDGAAALRQQRRDQENLIAQLKGGVKALAMPVGDLVSNWASPLESSA